MEGEAPDRQPIPFPFSQEDPRGFVPCNQQVIMYIDPLGQSCTAKANIKLRCTRTAFKEIKLYARNIDISSVSLDSVPAEYDFTALELSKVVNEVVKGDTESPIQYPNQLCEALNSKKDTTELSIRVPSSIDTANPGTMLTLTIEYSIRVDPLGVSLQLVQGKKDYFQVSAFGAAGMGRVWMPCFEEDPVPWDLEYCIKIDGLPTSSIQALNVASSGALCQQFTANGRKVYKFRLDLPTPARLISFAAGLFDMVKIPAAPFALAFCPRGMGASKLALAMEFFSRAFGFVNWYLGGAAFPYPSYYIVFLRDVLPINGSLDCANMSLLSSLSLFDSTIIDQNMVLRPLLAQSLTRQYFSIFLRPETCSAKWITAGIAGYLSRQLLRTFHGNNDYRYNLRQDTERLMGMESGHGALTEIPDTFQSPADEDWFDLKCYLILVVLDHRLEKGSLQKIITQLWNDAQVGGKLATVSLSTSYFIKLAKKVSGKDLKSFADQWLYSAGCPVFSCSFSFNRKRSTVEVDLKQTVLGNPQKKVAGSLLIRVHEIDGVFDHHVHIDDFSHHFELPVHARAKKIKRKKKEGKMTGGNTSIGGALAGNNTAPDTPADAGAEEDAFVSPLSWIRLDPDMEWLASLELHQPEFMWIEQLQSDRDVVAQHEALANLRRQPGEAVVEPIEKTLNDPKIFYRIRIEAAEVLAQCAPTPDTHIGGLKLVSFYNKGFALQSTETVVVPVPRTNNFEVLQSYLLQKALPVAMSMVRTKNGTLMELVGQILLNMMRFNDNTGNAYSDGYHVAAMINALCAHLQARRDLSLPVERLAREFVKELDRYSIVERIQPYYHNTVMVAILRAWKELRRMEVAISHAITRPEKLMIEGNFVKVRLAALEFFLATEPSLSESTFEAIESLLTNSKRYVRIEAAEMLSRLSAKQIPKKDDFSRFKDRLWRLVESNYTNPATVSRLFLFISRAIEVAPGDVSSGNTLPTGRLALRITVPTTTTQHELSSEGEAPEARDGGEGGEPDWFLEVSGEHQAATNSLGKRPPVSMDLPKLRFSVPPGAASIKSRLQSVFQTIWNNYDSFPFRFPVDPSVVGYYEVIKNPCDLSLIRGRLESGATESVAQFCEDLRLMFDNCFFFNLPDSLIYEQAKRLRSLAFKELRAGFPELARDIKVTLMTKEPNLSTLPAVTSATTWAPTLPKEKCNKKASRIKISKPNPSTVVTGEGINHKDSPVISLPVGERMRKVLEKAKAHPYAFWFLQPVDPVALDIPTYPEIIKEPMDLSTLESRLKEGSLDAREFVRLLNLIFYNCTTFNPTNTVVHRNAIDIQRSMQKMVRKLLPEASNGGDDEDFKASVENSPVIPTPIKLKINFAAVTSPLEWVDKARGVLDKVSSHDLAAPFLQPVDPIALGIPNYPKLIKSPMDLSTIRTKLDTLPSQYPSSEEMNADFKLMFANCYKFNGKKAPISEAARTLEQFYEDLYFRAFS